ncbi:MAG: GGDEF domain-containing protein [Gammaproteobacteria bacterium]
MHTTRRVLFRIAIIVTGLELLIMLIIPLIPYPISSFQQALLDALVLISLSTPLIYIWVIRPFVAERDDALAQINHLAHVDPLTQLANRRLIAKCLETDIATSNRHRCHLAVLLIDLDGFKQVNDAYGHEAGDAVLVTIAGRLRSITRGEDVVGRLGGDEFVVLLNQLDADEHTARENARQVAEKIISLSSQPIDYQEISMQVGASVGIRLIGCDKVEPDTAINESDSALYHAKQSGRGCAVFYEE